MLEAHNAAGHLKTQDEAQLRVRRSIHSDQHKIDQHANIVEVSEPSQVPPFEYFIKHT